MLKIGVYRRSIKSEPIFGHLRNPCFLNEQTVRIGNISASFRHFHSENLFSIRAEDCIQRMFR